MGTGTIFAFAVAIGSLTVALFASDKVEKLERRIEELEDE